MSFVCQFADGRVKTPGILPYPTGIQLHFVTGNPECLDYAGSYGLVSTCLRETGNFVFVFVFCFLSSIFYSIMKYTISSYLHIKVPVHFWGKTNKVVYTHNTECVNSSSIHTYIFTSIITTTYSFLTYLRYFIHTNTICSHV